MKRVNYILLLMTSFYGAAMENNRIVSPLAQVSQGLTDQDVQVLKNKFSFFFGQGTSAYQPPVQVPHDVQPKSVLSKNNTHSTKSYTCLMCKKNEGSWTALRNHLKGDHEACVIACPYTDCLLRFREEFDMIYHRDEHDWVCKNCNNKLLYNNFEIYSAHCNYMRHKFYGCHFCNAKFEHVQKSREHEICEHQKEIIEYTRAAQDAKRQQAKDVLNYLLKDTTMD